MIYNNNHTFAVNNILFWDCIVAMICSNNNYTQYILGLHNLQTNVLAISTGTTVCAYTCVFVRVCVCVRMCRTNSAVVSSTIYFGGGLLY